MDVKPYNMNHKSRGPVLIFNNMEYTYDGLEERMFSDVDYANMHESLKDLGYIDITMKRDLTADDMLYEIRKVAAKDLTDADSVVLVFLSYGRDNLIYANDKQVGIQQLIAPLNRDVCHPSIVGKPKIIILQTCNPTRTITANSVPFRDTTCNPTRTITANSVPFGDTVTRVIPAEADFLFLGSDVPGLISRDSVKDGSIYIDHLSRCLQDRVENEEICSIMTRVIEKCVQEMDEWKPDWEEINDGRIPYMINMLTRELYFKRR